MTGRMMLENEIGLARRSRVPVLISAPADRALAMAHAIADGAPGTTPVVECDGASIVDAAQRQAPAATENEIVMIVREVHMLSDFEQAGLMQLLDDGAGVGRRRIITTSSASLFDRVEQGKFSETLFYRLNAIHIMSDGGSDGLTLKKNKNRVEGPGGTYWGAPGNLSAPVS